MCKRLSERAADDLIAFVREVRREEAGVPHYAVRGVCYEKLQHLAARALSIMDKHGLLTPADDPDVAAVFMETPEDEAKHFLRCVRCGKRVSAAKDGCFNPKCESYVRRLAGSPSRFHYSETKE